MIHIAGEFPNKFTETQYTKKLRGGLAKAKANSGQVIGEMIENTGIPVRMLEDWEAGRRTPPEYIPRLIEYQLKYEKLEKEKLRKYAEYQDMTIVSEFSDEGFSGKNIKGRPEFSRMMEKIGSGEDNEDFVLVFKLSHYGRNAADVLNSLHVCE